MARIFPKLKQYDTVINEYFHHYVIQISIQEQFSSENDFRKLTVLLSSSQVINLIYNNYNNDGSPVALILTLDWYLIMFWHIQLKIYMLCSLR